MLPSAPAYSPRLPDPTRQRAWFLLITRAAFLKGTFTSLSISALGSSVD